MKNSENFYRFDNGMTMQETFLALVYLPIHVYVIPVLLGKIYGAGLGEVMLNFICYAIGTVYMLLTQWRILRRDYHLFCSRFFSNVLDIACCYFGMVALNTLVALAFQYITPVGNPNNAAVVTLVNSDYGKTAAMTIYLAPIVEELIFRAGLFGGLSHGSRALAYIGTAILFSLYHIWSFLLIDIRYIIYIVQYIPVTLLLCRAYERSGSIWSSIFFHMIVNAVSMRALEVLGSLM